MTRRIAVILLFLILYTGYVVVFYNSLPGESRIYQPLGIDIEADLPPESDLKVIFYTHNDPFDPQEAAMYETDTSLSGSGSFRAGPGYLISDIKIYFSNLLPGRSVTVKKVLLSGGEGERMIPLDTRFISVSEVLDYKTDNSGNLVLVRKEEGLTSGPSITFKLSAGMVNTLISDTGARKPVTPDLLTGPVILFSGIMLLWLLAALYKRAGCRTNLNPGNLLICLTAFLLPTGEQIVNLLFILVFLWTMGQLIIRGGIGAAFKKIMPLTILSLVLILLYTFSLLSGGLESNGASLYTIKIALPLVLLSMGLALRSAGEVIQATLFFIAGTLCSVIIHIALLILFTGENGLPQPGIRNFLYVSETFIFSRVHHSYLAMSYAGAIAALLLPNTGLRTGGVVRILAVIILAIGIILSWSRAGIMALAFIGIMMGLRVIFRGSYRQLISIGSVAIPAAGSVFFIIYLAGTISISGLSENHNNRVTIWENSRELISEKPLTGYGITGFNRELDRLNSTDLSTEDFGIHYNAHNQFLETAGMFGVPAAILFLWILFVPAIKGKRDYSREYGFITAVLIVIFFLFETFLNRNLGVMLSGFIFSVGVLLILYRDKSDTVSTLTVNEGEFRDEKQLTAVKEMGNERLNDPETGKGQDK